MGMNQVWLVGGGIVFGHPAELGHDLGQEGGVAARSNSPPS